MNVNCPFVKFHNLCQVQERAAVYKDPFELAHQVFPKVYNDVYG